MGSFRLRQLHNVLKRSTVVQQCHDFSTSDPAVISVTPATSLFDQEVQIKVHGLPSKAKVTVQGSVYSTWNQKNTLFVSYAHYVASQDGRLDLEKDASVGGSFTGVEPMGLFWSLGAIPGEPKDICLIWKDVEKPVDLHLAVFKGHITPRKGSVTYSNIVPTPLCSTSVPRYFKAADVKRIEIREGRVRGTLFLPSGDGPFPGVIDMFGTAGGIIETRAALLASHGFAALSLAFFKYLDLPSTLEKIDMDYFEEAIAWLSSHPSVRPGGIGVMGVSAGATIALEMAWLCPQVKAVVQINGPAFPFPVYLHYRGQMLRKEVPMVESRLKRTGDGVMAIDSFPYTASDLLPMWETSAHLLFLVSDDDKMNSPTLADHLQSMYPVEKRHLIEVVHYPGAGHLLEPPYSPHCYACFNPGAGLKCVWGGSAKSHAMAQEHAWKRALSFLHTHLS